MRQFVYTMFISNIRASSHIQWNENLVKQEKVLKYYENVWRLGTIIFIHLQSVIIFIIFWDSSIFEQIFVSLHVKRSVIIAHELPNDLRLRILEN